MLRLKEKHRQIFARHGTVNMSVFDHYMGVYKVHAHSVDLPLSCICGKDAPHPTPLVSKLSERHNRIQGHDGDLM